MLDKCETKVYNVKQGGMKMKILDFIRDNADWESLLCKKPYCLKVKKDGRYIMLSYNQIESDFYNPVVRECRGIILDEETLAPVCVPFFKFGNYGEGYVPEIDWASAKTQEKVDGSLIKVWYHDGKWRVSTNGTIDAYKCPLGLVDFAKMDCPYETFGDLFDVAKRRARLDFDKLDKGNTYMFELVSPYNKVVVNYQDIEIYHIGTRNNKTFEELNVEIGIKKPKQYPLHSLEDCIKSASELTFNEEGYVVVDRHWNRVKVKSPAYVAVHHLKGNDELNIKSVIELIKENEIEEFLSYFPEYTKAINLIRKKIDDIIFSLEQGVLEVSKKNYKSQKDFAIDVKDRPFSAFYFAWKKNGVNPKEWVWNTDSKKIREWIK